MAVEAGNRPACRPAGRRLRLYVLTATTQKFREAVQALIRVTKKGGGAYGVS